MGVALCAEITSDLIGRIYDCALDPTQWSATLAELRYALGFAHATLSLQAMPSGRVLLNVTSGIPSPWLERINDYGRDIVDLWQGPAAIASAPLEEPILLSDVNPTILDGSCTNPYYREWRQPQGLIDTIAIGLARDASSIAAASLVRHVDQGPVGDAERAGARLFAPHLRRAVTISRLLDAGRLTAETISATLDAANIPVLVVGPDLHLLHASAAAAALIGVGDLASLSQGLLRLANPAAEALLRAAVAQCCRNEAALDRRGFGIPVRRADETSCALHVLPLTGGSIRSTLVTGAAAAIFVAAEGALRGDVGAIIAPLFGLTPAEVRVFDLLARGATVSDVADRLGSSIRTVRTHLSRLFEKTGCERQADLIRIAAALSHPMPGFD